MTSAFRIAIGTFPGKSAEAVYKFKIIVIVSPEWRGGYEF
jgi:hypothetical protein